MAESKPKKSTSSAKPTKMTDVTPANQTAAPSTSRPVIVGHTNSMQKDPMVAAPPVAVPKEEIIEKPKKELVVEPEAPETEPAAVEAEAVSDETDVDSVEAPAEEPKTADASDSTDSEQKPTEAQTPDVEESSQVSETGAVDAIVNEVNTQKDRIKQVEAEEKLNEELQKLALSKKYYVKTRMPANKRNMRWLLVLLLIAVLAGAAWYFGVGPGKSYWDKSTSITTVSPQPAAAPEPTTPTPPPAAVANETFSKPELGIGFTYPKDWKIETTKDTEFPTRDVITLISPTETLKSSPKAGPSVDAEVFLRTRIFVENTTDPKEYASDLVKMSACSSEDIVVANATMKLLYVDLSTEAPNISQVSLGPENCVPTGSLFSANDQIQFGSKKNTYIIYTEYVFSDAYLKKVGKTTPEAIALAQESGVVMTKDDFKAGKNYVKFTEIAKSIKEQ